MRRFAAPFLMLGLAVVLMGAGVAAGAPNKGAGPHIFTDSGLTLELTSSMPGVTFSGNTLVCPPLLITASSGQNLAACEFTISSAGAVAPSSVEVTMTVSGISVAQAAAVKFAIAPGPGPGALIPFQTTTQMLYSFTGADLPVTVSPGVVWGANAGTDLDNGDLGMGIVVTYAVIAESLQGATAVPTSSTTPPPTASATQSSNGSSIPLFALMICFLLGGIGMLAAQFQRRSLRR